MSQLPRKKYGFPNRAETTQFTIQVESLENARDVSFGTMVLDNRSGRMQEVIIVLELLPIPYHF
jgi:hypothetical protein